MIMKPEDIDTRPGEAIAGLIFLIVAAGLLFLLVHSPTAAAGQREYAGQQPTIGLTVKDAYFCKRRDMADGLMITSAHGNPGDFGFMVDHVESQELCMRVASTDITATEVTHWTAYLESPNYDLFLYHIETRIPGSPFQYGNYTVMLPKGQTPEVQ